MRPRIFLLALAACKQHPAALPDAAPDARPDAALPDAAPDARPDAPIIDGQRVFATSKLYRGYAIGGVDGADAICSQLATDAGLPGVYKAWLSQVGTSVATRLDHATKPYVLVDRTTEVAGSWTDLLNTDLQHPIDLDETGALVTPAPTTGTSVWTDTMVDGHEYPWTPGGDPTSNPRFDCTLWSSSTGGVGFVGHWDQTSAAWTATAFGWGCTESARLYCFEQ